MLISEFGFLFSGLPHHFLFPHFCSVTTPTKSKMKSLLITPEGLEKLKAELDHLWRVERPTPHKKLPGRQALAIVLKTQTIITIKNAFAKLTGESFIYANVSMT